jgi:hypothetical protein
MLNGMWHLSLAVDHSYPGVGSNGDFYEGDILPILVESLKEEVSRDFSHQKMFLKSWS